MKPSSRATEDHDDRRDRRVDPAREVEPLAEGARPSARDRDGGLRSTAVSSPSSRELRHAPSARGTCRDAADGRPRREPAGRSHEREDATWRPGRRTGGISSFWTCRAQHVVDERLGQAGRLALRVHVAEGLELVGAVGHVVDVASTPSSWRPVTVGLVGLVVGEADEAGRAGRRLDGLATAPFESSVRAWPVASSAPPSTIFLKVARVPETPGGGSGRSPGRDRRRPSSW